MAKNYLQNVLLAVIALALVAIAAKLYVPAANEIGPWLSPPTRADFYALRGINDSKARSAAYKKLLLHTPVVWINGGNVSVDGSVDVDNVNSTVDVSIVR